MTTPRLVTDADVRLIETTLKIIPEGPVKRDTQRWLETRKVLIEALEGAVHQTDLTGDIWRKDAATLLARLHEGGRE